MYRARKGGSQPICEIGRRGHCVNLGALIEHHCEIGDFSHIMMGAVIRGNAKLGEQSWVRANEVVEGEPAPMPKDFASGGFPK